MQNLKIQCKNELRNMNYPGMYLKKYVQALYTVNYEMLLKEIKEYKNKEIYNIIMD